MKICIFGTHSNISSRMQIIKLGFEDLGYKYSEINVPLSMEELDDKAHFKLYQIAWRIFRRFKLYVLAIVNYRVVINSDWLFLSFPSHLDVPLALLLGKLFNKKVAFDPCFSLYDTNIYDLNILDKNSIYAILLYKFEKYIFNGVDIVIADTNYQRNYYCQLFNIPKSKVEVVCLGANDRVYRTLSNQISDTTIVTYYGMYNPLHGVPYLMKAAKILMNNKTIQFDCIGVGQTYAESVAIAKNLGLTNVRFLELREKEAVPYLKKSDIFIGFLADSQTAKKQIPNKVFQGLALGKTILTARSPAIESELEDNVSVVLVNPSDPIDIANKILYLSKNKVKSRKIAEKGNKIYTDRFTPKKIGLQLLKIMSNT